MMKGKLSEYKTKEEVLEVFPNAVFMPWEEPTPSLRIKKGGGVQGSIDTGTVIGREEAMQVPEPDHRCPMCRCMKPNPFYQWWKIRWDGWYKDPKGLGFRFYKADEVPKNIEPMIGLEYPPTLEKI